MRSAGRADIGRRFEGVFLLEGAGPEASRAELAAGLSRPQRTTPASFLYDSRGSLLFDRICATPEYYVTRTEQALLRRVAPDVAQRSAADTLVELGSGLARKTHLLLDALGARRRELLYVPFDVSEIALHRSAERLLAELPRLRVRGIVGDYTRGLVALPEGGRRLVAFLGGTLGNFDAGEAVAFLRTVAASLSPDDHLLVGADLVKSRAQLHAAYNDAQGWTEAFNRNVLHRLKREYGALLEEERFSHQAYFDERASQIEMHLRAAAATEVAVPGLGLEFRLEAGESIRTEISRKFSRRWLHELLESAALEAEAVYIAEPPYALVLARPSP